MNFMFKAGWETAFCLENKAKTDKTNPVPIPLCRRAQTCGESRLCKIRHLGSPNEFIAHGKSQFTAQNTAQALASLLLRQQS